MKTIKLLDTLRKYPLFTLNDFVKITRKSPEYCRTYLYRLKKQGLIFQIERGKYTLYDDPIVFSCFIVQPCYFSHWSALRYYNLTDQLPIVVTLSSSRSRATIKFNGTTIVFLKTKYLWGYKKIRYNNFDVFMAEPEKAIIDFILSNSVSLGEIEDAIFSGKIDIDKLKEYVKRTGNIALIKRVGFLLDTNKKDAEDLVGFVDYNYISLILHSRKKGKINKKWRIVDNR